MFYSVRADSGQAVRDPATNVMAAHLLLIQPQQGSSHDVRAACRDLANTLKTGKSGKELDECFCSAAAFRGPACPG
jgi:hypothetical protein